MDTSAGEIIERTVRRSSKSISELAKKMNVSRGSFYYWFSQKKVDPAIILKIGELIGYDFRRDIPNLCDQKACNKTIADPVSQEVNYWKTKYLELAERYDQQLQRQDELAG